MKTITICGKKYEIACDGTTHFNFKRIFKDGIFKKIDILYKFNQRQALLANEFISENKQISNEELEKGLSLAMLQDLDDFIEAVTEITYILCYTANQKIGSYEEWLKGIEKINTNDDWIVEVTEIAVDCFC